MMKPKNGNGEISMTENKKTETKETKASESVYERLSKVDVSRFIEKKNGLNYLSWAKAWGLVKSIYPDANYKFREYPYFTQTADGNYQQCGTRDYLRTEYGVEVEASVIIQSKTYSSKLYVMDYHNRAMTPSKVTLFEINKTQMRALTKALAFAGLGLNIYAGEDLPSGEDKTPKRQEKPTKDELIEDKTPKQQEKPTKHKKRTKDELITIAQERRAQYGGGQELVTDIVGLEMDGDMQAAVFLNNWCAKSPKNQALYTFIKENKLDTHGMKVGA